MSSFTFMGREYNTNDFLKDVVNFAKMLAKNARLIDPLPANVDLSETEQKEVQDQVCSPNYLSDSRPNQPINTFHLQSDPRDDNPTPFRNHRLLVRLRSTSPHATGNLPPYSLARYPTPSPRHPNSDSFPPPRSQNRPLLP
jgi:hypothetical protein